MNYNINNLIGCTHNSEQITVTVGTSVYTIPYSKKNLQEVQEKIDEGREAVIDYMQPGRRLLAEDDRLSMDPHTNEMYLTGTDRPIPPQLQEHLRQLLGQGLSVEALINFHKLTLLNPNWESVEQLYRFLTHNNVPLTPEGLVVTYRVVTKAPYFGVNRDTGETKELGVSLHPQIRDGEDQDKPYVRRDLAEISERIRFVDMYTGTFDNSVGEMPEMPREEVTFDPEVHCGPGLHGAAPHYIPFYGGGGNPIRPPKGRSWNDMSLQEQYEHVKQSDAAPVTINLVHPADVVSVPNDLRHAKMRSCRFFVAGLYNSTYREPVVDLNIDASPLMDKYAAEEAALDAKIEAAIAENA